MNRCTPPIPDFVFQPMPGALNGSPLYVYPVTRDAWAWWDKHHGKAEFLMFYDGEAAEAAFTSMEAEGLWVKPC